MSLLTDQVAQASDVSKSAAPVRSLALDVASLGPLCLGISISAQYMVAAFVLFGPILHPVLPAMTARGKVLALPERDLPLYMAGLTGAIAFSGVLLWLWQQTFLSKAANTDAATGDERAAACFSSALMTSLATGSMICFLILLSSRFPALNNQPRAPAGRFTNFILLLPAISAVITAAIDLFFNLKRAPAPNLKAIAVAPRNLSVTCIRWILDASICILIVLLVFIPRSHWTHLAGAFYQDDELHHINFFAFGPALEFIHGKAFGTAFYSQYGIGWTLTFAFLCKFTSFTYAHLIGMEIIYGCIYYVALYALLRLLLRSQPLATAGVMLCILIQLFSGIEVGGIMWNFPSSTVLRHPADVWFFIALLAHRITGRSSWIAAAGIIAGVGIVFETDTGIYLLATFAFYLGLCWLNSNSTQRPALSSSLRHAALFAGAMFSVLLIGLWIGSRGTLFRAAFARGWLEGLQLQAFSGVGLMPIAGVDDDGILMFVSMICVYLLAVAWGISRHLAAKAPPEETLIACIGAYGLAVLLLFVGRSHPFNMYHCAIPFVIVIVYFLNQIRILALPRLPRTSIPWVFALCTIFALWGKPQFVTYPSLASAAFAAPPPTGIALRQHPADLAGLSDRYQRQADTLQRVALLMHRLAATGKQILVLDDLDTLLYYLSGTAPWSRYSSLFPVMYTQQAVRDVEKEILTRKPTFIVIRDAPPPKWAFEDLWDDFHPFLQVHYKLQEHLGMYELWRLRAPTTAK